MNGNDLPDEGGDLEKLLEHLTLQNDAFSSSNKLLMSYYKSLKAQTCNLMSLIKALICITSPNKLASQEDHTSSEIVNSCKLNWVEALYDFLSITEHDLETTTISPVLEDSSLPDAKFELKMSLLNSEVGLSKSQTAAKFYSSIATTLNLIHDPSGIQEFIQNTLELLEDPSKESTESSFNIYFVKLYNGSSSSEEAILLTSSKNEESSLMFSERLNFIDPSKYFCLDKSLLFNKFNLRFLIYNRNGGLCWSDRICDMNSQIFQDYYFVFRFDNPKRKLIFNIISSFNLFISNFILKSIDSLNIDQLNLSISSFNRDGTGVEKEISSQENKPLEPLSPTEIFHKIQNVLSSNKSILKTSLISPSSDLHSSIINSINSFTSCVSQEIHLDKIDISSNQTFIQRSDSDITTLSEFIEESTNKYISPDSHQNVNIDFFYENNFHSHEWVLL
ncbi:hypothetical protein HWI79_2303 [Cryptosporidium felis]|nr:hypothetical protein HWI79_2303 [Cryptosporidium felis]